VHSTFELAFFVASIACVLVLIARLARGFPKELVRRYGSHDAPSAETFAMQSLVLGGVGYRGMVTIGVEEGGIRLSSAAFQTLFIPWRALRVVRPRLLVGGFVLGVEGVDESLDFTGDARRAIERRLAMIPTDAR